MKPEVKKLSSTSSPTSTLHPRLKINNEGKIKGKNEKRRNNRKQQKIKEVCLENEI